MEAANRGRPGPGRVHCLNIKLPREQKANCYANQAITFHHFFVRKVLLFKYTSFFIFMPGGLGPLDEMSEVLTLMQTQTIRPFPVLLFGREYWRGLLDWLRDTCLRQGYISADDLDLVRVCDTLDEVTDAVRKWHDEHELAGSRAVNSHATKISSSGRRRVGVPNLRSFYYQHGCAHAACA